MTKYLPNIHCNIFIQIEDLRSNFDQILALFKWLFQLSLRFLNEFFCFIFENEWMKQHFGDGNVCSYCYDWLCFQDHEEETLFLLRVKSSTFQNVIQPIFAFLSVTVSTFPISIKNQQTTTTTKKQKQMQNILLIISLHDKSFVVVVVVVWEDHSMLKLPQGSLCFAPFYLFCIF
jgi:hypothetical protein